MDAWSYMQESYTSYTSIDSVGRPWINSDTFFSEPFWSSYSTSTFYTYLLDNNTPPFQWYSLQKLDWGRLQDYHTGLESGSDELPTWWEGFDWAYYTTVFSWYPSYVGTTSYGEVNPVFSTDRYIYFQQYSYQGESDSACDTPTTWFWNPYCDEDIWILDACIFVYNWADSYYAIASKVGYDADSDYMYVRKYDVDDDACQGSNEIYWFEMNTCYNQLECTDTSTYLYYFNWYYSSTESFFVSSWACDGLAWIVRDDWTRDLWCAGTGLYTSLSAIATLMLLQM
jgi:hypothetical protein